MRTLFQVEIIQATESNWQHGCIIGKHRKAKQGKAGKERERKGNQATSKKPTSPASPASPRKCRGYRVHHLHHLQALAIRSDLNSYGMPSLILAQQQQQQQCKQHAPVVCDRVRNFSAPPKAPNTTLATKSLSVPK